MPQGRNRGRRPPGVEPLDDRRGTHSLAGDVRATERDLRIDDDDLRAVDPSNGDREETDRQAFDVPVDTLQMGLQQLSQNELPCSAQVDQLVEAFQEDGACGGAQLVAQQKPCDLEFILGIVERRADGGHGNLVPGPERPEHMGLDEIVERQPEVLLVGPGNQRLGVAAFSTRRIGSADHPGAQGRGRDAQILSGLPDRISRALGGLAQQVAHFGRHDPCLPARSLQARGAQRHPAAGETARRSRTAGRARRRRGATPPGRRESSIIGRSLPISPSACAAPSGCRSRPRSTSSARSRSDRRPARGRSPCGRTGRRPPRAPPP